MRKNTDIEVVLDIDRLPRDIGIRSPSGRIDFNDDDVEDILEWAEDRIATEYPITVVIRGYCPHFVLVVLQHLVEVYAAEGSVVRYDFVPLRGKRFTVFDRSDEVLA
jgi:hypothetical protein